MYPGSDMSSTNSVDLRLFCRAAGSRLARGTRLRVIFDLLIVAVLRRVSVSQLPLIAARTPNDDEYRAAIKWSAAISP